MILMLVTGGRSRGIMTKSKATNKCAPKVATPTTLRTDDKQTFHSDCNDQYRNAAVLTCALFAGGLLAGRLVSLLIDGRPSPILLVYVVIELALVPVAIWIFRLPH